MSETEDLVSALDALKESVVDYVDVHVDSVRQEARRMYYVVLGASILVSLLLFAAAMMIQEGPL